MNLLKQEMTDEYNKMKKIHLILFKLIAYILSGDRAR